MRLKKRKKNGDKSYLDPEYLLKLSKFISVWVGQCSTSRLLFKSWVRPK